MSRDSAIGVALGSLVVALLVTAAVPSHAEPREPSVVVQTFDDRLLAAMSGAKTLGYRGRYDLLEPAVNETFDIPAMVRIAVGPGLGQGLGKPEGSPDRSIRSLHNRDLRRAFR